MSEYKPVKRLRLILGDQLNAAHSWYQQQDDDTLYVIAELQQETDYVKHHVQKVCAFFAAMEAFAIALQTAGHKVVHLTLDDTAQYAGLPALLLELIERYQVSEFHYQLPDEYRLRKQLSLFSRELSISYMAFETEHFYLSDSELKGYFSTGKKHRLEHFYRKLRRRFRLLMQGNEPAGGQWNYDADNRQKLKTADFESVPAPLVFANDVSAILQRLQRHNVTSIGTAHTALLWPVNRKQANELLQSFCRNCLINFGRFQDAMTHKLDASATQVSGELALSSEPEIEPNSALKTEQVAIAEYKKQWSLYHSRLSFALNAKILSPQHVVDSAIAFFKQSDGAITLAQIEGFVRQILGWREFVRGVYWAHMPDYASLNHLNANRQLPRWFWDGNTKMNCMQHAIKQSLEYAYAHHIQRLMVTGNFCLIAGIDPDEVDAWYLGIYIDAIEWVEMPNTRGMSQFADGGIVGSKAYAASGNYINKMSDYCSGCHYEVKQSHSDNACPLNALYWHFMQQHIDDFKANPRTRMVYANWLKKPEQTQQLILQRAEHLLAHIDNL
ncbi:MULTISPECIES: cryptochrome/photolyase family protein [unclassified Shewanella]|uniref:cryptochrome/photolyase family protein n=1 Tax=unclassified Shewanella TaxID=196818 RepID=UPI001BBF0AFE|nr:MULTISPECIES: cryptochrome/photolyase family protein [unclassified Shewanella]GIU05085.1 deoxyribodipyrimidine photo-lyase [Shewanella sp. MBTL60-112-B1]GIU24413.1 deoxyribodipyrimidine photo-lyase [Shewanella sp. MBTL60-112-B2]